MKKPSIIILAFIALVCLTLPVFAQNKPPVTVIAYYFHGTFRCITCTNMEKFSREAIETNFKDALVSGKLEFKAINVEERGNEHFAEDYQLYTKSLILSLIRDGREFKFKNLDKIWEYSRNKQKFIGYVTAEVTDFMKNAQ